MSPDLRAPLRLLAVGGTGLGRGSRIWTPLLGLLATALGVLPLGLLLLLAALASGLPARSWTRRLLYVLPVVVALLVSLLTLVAVLGRQVSATQLLVAMLLASFLPLLKRQPSARPTPGLAGADAWVLLLTTTVAALLARPFIGKSLSGVISLLSPTTDGGTHTQMVLATERAGGFLHLSDLPGLSPGVDNYPGAWSAMVWWFGSVLTDGPPDRAAAVHWVAVGGVSTFLLVTAFSGLLVHHLTERASVSGLGVRLFATLSLGGVLLGPGLLLMQTQSYPLLLSLALVLAAIAHHVERPSAAVDYVVVLACALGVAHSWYLLAPAALVLLLTAFWRARTAWRWVVPATASLVPVAAYPLLTGPRASAQLSMPGSTLLPTFPGILALIALTAFGALWLARGAVPSRESGIRLLVVLVTLLGLLTGLVVQRGMSAEGLSYYAAKTLTVTVLLGALAPIAWLARHVASSRLRAAAVVGLLVLSVVSVWPKVRPAWHPSPAGYVDPATITALLQHYPDGPPATTEVVVLDGCQRVEDFIATKWLYDLALTWTARRSDWLREHSSQEGVDLRALRAVVEDGSVRRVELVQHEPCLVEEVRRLAVDPKVRIIRVP